MSLLDALNVGRTHNGGSVIDIWLAGVGDSVTENDNHGNIQTTSVGYADADLAKMTQFLSSIEDYIDVDFRLVTEQNQADVEIYFDPDFGAINGYYGWAGWNSASNNTYLALDGTLDQLDPGSSFYTLLLHELGHYFALEHPFDSEQGTEVIQGYSADSTLADYNLNQVVHTVMSYNWEYQSWADPTVSFYSNPETYSALDVAVLQNLYGINTNYANGDDTYYLSDSGGFQLIWDTGGNDTIAYVGAGNAHLDLRSATLEYEDGGGGFLSYGDVSFSAQAFAIAASTNIENAIGADGADWLMGNADRNILNGNAGTDTLSGGAGDDRLDGGDDADNLDGGSGNDTLNAGSGADIVVDPLGNDNVEAGSGHDRVVLYSGINTVLGGTGNDLLVGGIQGDAIFGGDGNDLLKGDVGLGLTGGADTLIGESGNDIMMGGIGADVFVFRPNDGNDTIAGGDGSDVSFDPNTGYSLTAMYQDFEVGIDHIQLEGFSTVNSSNVMSFVSSAAQGAVFSAEGTDIAIYGVDAVSLTVDDFLFL